jgi:NAD+ synthetase
MPLPVYHGHRTGSTSDEALRLNTPLVADWLVRFLRFEVTQRRRVERVLLGLSGGIDSAVVAALCARAFGPDNVWAFRLPYKVSSQASLDDAELVAKHLGIRMETIDITAMVDGYLSELASPSAPVRVGNVCARARMIVLFDQSAALGALPIGTGNKTERLFGYFTWHGDDAPPINPIGDLFKTQVWAIARELGIPERVIEKPATADLVQGQTDEGDFGITYAEADRILYWMVQGFSRDQLIALGFEATSVEIVRRRVEGTHWKRRLPTVAMLSTTSIGDSYLRPVDY